MPDSASRLPRTAATCTSERPASRSARATSASVPVSVPDPCLYAPVPMPMTMEATIMRMTAAGARTARIPPVEAMAERTTSATVALAASAATVAAEELATPVAAAAPCAAAAPDAWAVALRAARNQARLVVPRAPSAATEAALAPGSCGAPALAERSLTPMTWARTAAGSAGAALAAIALLTRAQARSLVTAPSAAEPAAWAAAWSPSCSISPSADVEGSCATRAAVLVAATTRPTFLRATLWRRSFLTSPAASGITSPASTGPLPPPPGARRAVRAASLRASALSAGEAFAAFGLGRAPSPPWRGIPLRRARARSSRVPLMRPKRASSSMRLSSAMG